MPVGYAIAGSAVLGYVASSNATDAASAAAAQSNATARDTAQLQYDLGKETLDFQKDYYNTTLKPMQERDMALREKLTSATLDTMDKQQKFADSQNEFYKTTFQPLERQMVDEAKNYDSDTNVQRRMGIASANVNQQFSNAQQQSARSLARYGVNPNSSAFATTNAALTNAQALGSAGAQTGAAFDTMDKGIALRAGAANFGRNMPNTAAAYYAGGNQSAGVAGGTSAQGIASGISAVAPMSTGFNQAMTANGSAADILNNSFKNNMSMYNTQMQGISGMFSGIGSLAASKYGQQGLQSMGNDISGWFKGFGSGSGTDAAMTRDDIQGFADGGTPDGVVHGPGGPREDKVPAMLSRGEFVLNEGAVKHFGLSKLNKMNEVGLNNQAQRGLIRRA
jgi:hypothetical protein